MMDGFEVVVLILLAAFGTLCIVKPEPVAAFARQRHLRSNKFFQKWPFARMVLEPWLPTYLRCMGVVCWLLVLLVWFAATFGQR